MTKEYSWMLGPFEKAAEANPCLVPNAVSRFFCPVQEKELGWEAKDVFNPARLCDGTLLSGSEGILSCGGKRRADLSGFCQAGKRKRESGHSYGSGSGDSGISL